MPLYRALAPLSFINDDGRVTHITQVGAVFSATTGQAATVPESLIQYVGTGSKPALAPRMDILLFDNSATFPEVGSETTLYLDQDAGELYYWFGGSYIQLV